MKLAALFAALCTLSLAATTASAQSRDSILTQIRQLDGTVNRDGDALTQTQLSQLSSLLRQAQDIADHVGGSGGGSDCYDRAYAGPFSSAEAMDLCSGGGTVETAQCALNAYAGPYSKEQSIQLCKFRGTPETVQCANDVYSGPFSRDQSITVCSRGGSMGTARCARGAYSGPFSSDQAVRLCQHGGDDATLQCATNAYRSHSAEESITLCANP